MMTSLARLVHTCDADKRCVYISPGCSLLRVRGPTAPAPSSGTQKGCVANFAQEVVKGQLPLSGWGLDGQGVEQFGRSEALVSLLDHQLPFLDESMEMLGIMPRQAVPRPPCQGTTASTRHPVEFIPIKPSVAMV